jgi:hypothetical protein
MAVLARSVPGRFEGRVPSVRVRRSPLEAEQGSRRRFRAGRRSQLLALPPKQIRATATLPKVAFLAPAPGVAVDTPPRLV